MNNHDPPFIPIPAIRRRPEHKAKTNALDTRHITFRQLRHRNGETPCPSK